MANTHLMIDLETLATTPDATIITIGAVRFDPFGDDVNDPQMDSFYVRVDIDSCDRLGLATDDNTIAWWAKQDQEAQDEAFGEENRIDIADAMAQLYKFARGCSRVWSHGAAFDIVICETIFRKLGRAIPWNFWDVRCTRTLFDIGMNPNRPEVLKHHALQDAWNQAVGVQNVYRTLKGCTTLDGTYLNPLGK